MPAAKRLLSWIILGLFLYMMLQGSGSQTPPLPSPEAATAEKAGPSEEASEAATESSTANFKKTTDIEHWKRALNPEYAANFQCTLPEPAQTNTPQLSWRVTEEKSGSGSGAGCSETITVKLTVWNPTGGVAYTTTTEIQLGARQLAAGLDAALLGMRKGGKRTVILGPSALFRAKEAQPPKALAAALGKDRVVVVTAEREF